MGDVSLFFSVEDKTESNLSLEKKKKSLIGLVNKWMTIRNLESFCS